MFFLFGVGRKSLVSEHDDDVVAAYSRALPLLLLDNTSFFTVEDDIDGVIAVAVHSVLSILCGVVVTKATHPMQYPYIGISRGRGLFSTVFFDDVVSSPSLSIINDEAAAVASSIAAG